MTRSAHLRVPGAWKAKHNLQDLLASLRQFSHICINGPAELHGNTDNLEFASTASMLKKTAVSVRQFLL